ncbi:MAG TPA: succinate dehydrogenase/fumarate reductase iron-sulfur subunit [Candidatus Xenobia bacterium]|nr:succinate dehydrogenase/fumarate reductase iron-sulfur subunit [Candidatus Xenobia bacterium]
MAELIQLEVTRYQPERDAAPRTETFDVPLRDDWTVLDALNYIKDREDGSLAYRWSCRMGVCGSCGMMVNGYPKLTCATFLVDYAEQREPVRVEPLAYFPIIRDLVVDLTDFLHKLRKVKPWLVVEKEKPLAEGEYKQTPAQLEQYKQFSMCINCLLCYAACPVIGLEPGFLGPAVIALARRYNLDNRDQGAGERLELCTERDGIWQCTFVGECSKVCPKNVDPAGAIQQYKIEAALHALKSFLLPWSAR